MNSVSTAAASFAALSLALVSSLSSVASAEEGATATAAIHAPMGANGSVPSTVTTCSWILLSGSTTKGKSTIDPFIGEFPAAIFATKRHFAGSSDERGGICNVHVSRITGGLEGLAPVHFNQGDLTTGLYVHGTAAAHPVIPAEAIAFITMGFVPLNLDLKAKEMDLEDSKSGTYSLEDFTLGPVSPNLYDYEPATPGAANVQAQGGTYK